MIGTETAALSARFRLSSDIATIVRGNTRHARIISRTPMRRLLIVAAVSALGSTISGKFGEVVTGMGGTVEAPADDA